jgi:predicted transcriptional regulator
MKKRNRTEIIYDILECISQAGEQKITKIISKSNLTHTRVKPIIENLLNRDLIAFNEKDKTYILTEDGYIYLKEYKAVHRFISAFD